jgi:glycosyltransferase involved in cell wall biosynthesis
MEPKVSFVIPCYNLAHFLGDCVNSILSQTYDDFEILIMDDCSPDNTPEVAAEFEDPRVIYIRNVPNLGHICNYNKGIELARGRYIWLISADDCLRSRNVLEKFVEVLDQNPNVGYVFCPAMVLRDGNEAGVIGRVNRNGHLVEILSGRELVRSSAYNCPLVSPTALVRKECYTNVGGFPLNQPRTADWYLWAMFAMSYDVGFFAKPMVYYRLHSANMETTLEQEQPSFYFGSELSARWTIKREAEKAGFSDLRPDFYRGLADAYTTRLVRKVTEDWPQGYTWDAAEQEIRANASDDNEAEEILLLMRTGWLSALASGHSFAGTVHYQTGQIDKAVAAFRYALALKPGDIRLRVYLCASRLEQICGVRLYYWLKLTRNAMQWFLRPRTRRASIFSH